MKEDLLPLPAHLSPLSLFLQAQNKATFGGRHKELLPLIKERVKIGELNIREWERSGGCKVFRRWKGMRFRSGKWMGKDDGYTDGGEEEMKWIKVGGWEYGRVRELDGDGKVIVGLDERDGGDRENGGACFGRLFFLVVVLWLVFWWIGKGKRKRPRKEQEEIELDILGTRREAKE